MILLTLKEDFSAINQNFVILTFVKIKLTQYLFVEHYT